MKKLLFFLISALALTYSFAQNVAINADASLPNSSAMLDVKSANKGLLMPRVALTGTDDITTIASPVASLMIYNTATTTGTTAVTPGYYYRTATAWQKMMNVPNGTTTGQMLYWSGTEWLTIAPGSAGQYLQFGLNNLPNWTGAVFASLTTTAVSGTSYYYAATAGGNIANDGGSPVTARGVCWSTSPNPTITNSKTTDGAGTGIYSSTLTGLLPSTLYYVRSYATTTPGTGYGNEISFTTVPHSLPAVSTIAVTGITADRANSGVNATAENGSPVTAKGVCWSTSPNPTIANSKTTNGTGLGSVSSIITGLTVNTLYYLRAYATNSFGTAYGTELSFSTATTVNIGESYQGGIVAYILQAGDPGYIAGQIHGLIATPSDQSSGILWTSNAVLNATSTSLGQGTNNTFQMWNQGSLSDRAGSICYSLVFGGYSDWFLPSKDELNKLYLNRVAIGNFNNTGVYWSSSGINSPASNGWAQQFVDGIQLNNRTAASFVRAIRKF